MKEILDLLIYLYEHRNDEGVFLRKNTPSSLEVLKLDTDNFGKIFYIEYAHSFKKYKIEIELRSNGSIINLEIDNYQFYYCDYADNYFVNISYYTGKNYLYLFSYDLSMNSFYRLTMNEDIKKFIDEEDITNISEFTEEIMFYLKLKGIL